MAPRMTTNTATGPGATAAANYSPKNMTPAEWAQWCTPVRALLAEAHPASATSVRAAGSAIAALLQVCSPLPGTGLAEVLSDSRIAMTVASMRRSGRAERTLSRSLEDLQRLQRVARGFEAVPARRTTVKRDVLSAAHLHEIAEGADREAAALAWRVLAQLHEVQPAPWKNPLSADEATAVIRAARERGIAVWRMDWSHLKTERLREEMATDRAFLDLLEVGALSPARLAEVTRGGGPDVPGAGEALRGSATVPIGRAWRIKDGGVGTAEETREAPDTPAPRRSRPTSAAAARRKAAEVRAVNEATAKPMAEDLEGILRHWTPHVLNREQWEQARPLTFEIVRRSHVRGPESVRKHLRVVARFVSWTVARGYRQVPAAVLSGEVIDLYIRQGMGKAEDSTRATARSQLRSLAREIGASPDAPTRETRVRRWDAKAPYSGAEVKQILTRVDLVTNDSVRARLQIVTALGLGAGLDVQDLTSLRRRDIADHGADGIEIEVRGQRQRTVWLRREYEGLLRTGLAGLGRCQHVLGKANAGRNILTHLYESIQPTGTGPRVQQGRMRNTWLAVLMTEAVPVWTILTAAGLQGARTLTDIAQTLEPVIDGRDVRGAL